jgi:hypothetical protein
MPTKTNIRLTLFGTLVQSMDDSVFILSPAGTSLKLQTTDATRQTLSDLMDKRVCVTGYVAYSDEGRTMWLIPERIT